MYLSAPTNGFPSPQSSANFTTPGANSDRHRQQVGRGAAASPRSRAAGRTAHRFLGLGFGLFSPTGKSSPLFSLSLSLFSFSVALVKRARFLPAPSGWFPRRCRAGGGAHQRPPPAGGVAAARLGRAGLRGCGVPSRRARRRPLPLQGKLLCAFNFSEQPGLWQLVIPTPLQQ